MKTRLPLAALAALLALPAAAQDAQPSLSNKAVRDIVELDKEMRQSSPEPPPPKFSAGEARQKRIDKQFEAAAAAVPPKPWEAPKVTVIADQGGYDRRIYKVVSGGGTYCIYVESNHAPDGIDIGRQGLKSKVRTCPREE